MQNFLGVYYERYDINICRIYLMFFFTENVAEYRPSILSATFHIEPYKRSFLHM